LEPPGDQLRNRRSRRSCGQLATPAGASKSPREEKKGDISADELRQVEDRCICDVVKDAGSFGLEESPIANTGEVHGTLTFSGRHVRRDSKIGDDIFRPGDAAASHGTSEKYPGHRLHPFKRSKMFKSFSQKPILV